MADLQASIEELWERRDGLSPADTEAAALVEQAIALLDATQGGVLYVATSGPPFPLQIVQRGSNAGSISFSEWNKPVSLSVPEKAVDLSQLRSH